MKKLRLDFENLKIDTFDTTPHQVDRSVHAQATHLTCFETCVWGACNSTNAYCDTSPTNCSDPVLCPGYTQPGTCTNDHCTACGEVC